ncbi:MAG: DUF4878 domain-containing protein [Capnocytophaga sp.]|nr:DUF4878 domain-containing protein [Capnocytophaga sp.]
MKKFLILVMVLLGIVSCSKNTPEAVTQSFVTAMNQNQFREAQKYVDEPSSKIIDEIIKVITANNEKLPENEKVNFNVTRVEQENENRACVYFTIKKGGNEEHLHLNKVNDQWKVSLEFMQDGDSHQHCNH